VQGEVREPEWDSVRRSGPRRLPRAGHVRRLLDKPVRRTRRLSTESRSSGPSPIGK